MTRLDSKCQLTDEYTFYKINSVYLRTQYLYSKIVTATGRR